MRHSFGHFSDHFFSAGFGPCGRFSAGRGRGRGGEHGGHRRHGPFGGPGGFFGHMADHARMRSGRVLSSDDLQLVILSLVEEKPRHGYEIIKALEEKSSGVYKPSPGMIYPALTYLEEADYVESSSEGAKKSISLKPEGKKVLDENRDHIAAVLARLQEYGERMSYFQQQMNQEEEVEAQWREMREEFRDIRHDLKQALFSKFAASTEEKKRVLDILKKAIAEIRKG
jgi:DNA-binding PadR family transcriptional regulator